MQTEDEKAVRKEIVETCRGMNSSGVNKNASGNVSSRFGEGFLISPTGIAYDILSPDMVVYVKMDGTYEGNIKPSSEWFFHRDIYASRSDLDAVVHTHSTYATSLAILGMEIPAIHYSIAAVGGPNIRCAKYATFGTQELSDNAMAALKDRRACLLEHHGVIAAHRTLKRALSLAILVELLAQQYLICREVREPPVLDDEEIARVIGKYQTYGNQVLDTAK
jgi:L-fuculose-phosphate aldolase